MCPIKRRSFLGSSAALVGSGFIAGSQAHNLDYSHESPAAVQHHLSAVFLMTETANRFLAALSLKLRAKATFPFGDEETLEGFMAVFPWVAALRVRDSSLEG